MENYSEEGLVNIGVGNDITIKDLALMIKDIVGFDGGLNFDATKPDGTPRKLVDVSKINGLGWKAGIELKDGEMHLTGFCLKNYRTATYREINF